MPTKVRRQNTAARFTPFGSKLKFYARQYEAEYRYGVRYVTDSGEEIGTSVTIARKGAWQKGHYHTSITETYFVVRGWIAILEIGMGEPNPQRSFYTKNSPPRAVGPQHGAHVIYLSGDAIVCVVKHGGRSGETDWHDSPFLDGVTESITESMLIQDVNFPS